MRSRKKVLWPIFMVLPLLLSFAAYADDDFEDEVPDVTARVSRISFIRGDVQIKRDGSQDWEKAVLNLPIVEGDEITTDSTGRVEIQLNAYSHIRLAESSYLKFVGLKDGAVALSLSEGSMNVRLTRFDKDSAFFEIDAPKTTVAIQKSGMYRIDAGKAGISDVRVAVTNDGEARVYAENSGFTLKNGRTASIKIDGPYSGEVDTDDVSMFIDEFDRWALDRDATIAKLLKDAHYDRYYDQDIYGAEDLRDYGEWVYTRKYGYVWKPYRSATSSYVNWTPYRYGHWRWVPPYGWTWVNDEPWGWATYHHGRWVFDDGYWYWTPYGSVRRSRSWWLPALIGVTIVNNNICWYPLPHGYGYYNYNYYFGGWGGPRGGHHGGGPRGNNHGGPPRGGGNPGGGPPRGGGNNGGGVGPVATPTPPAYVGPLPGQVGPSVFTDNNSRRAWFKTPPLLRVPPGAVVSTPISDFGRETKGYVSPSPIEAKNVLTKALAENKTGRILPTYGELDGKVSTAIKVERPRTVAMIKPTGAAVRDADGSPMDQKLMEMKIRGDRTPVRPEVRGDGGVTGNSGAIGEPRKTGAVTRLPPVRQEVDEPIRPERQVEPSKTRRDVEPVRPEVRSSPETKVRENRDVEPIRPEPRSEPRKERYDPPPTRSEPVRPEPRNEPVRNEPPRSEPVRNSPPPKSEPPPSKSESKPVDRKGKDNR